MGLDIYLEKFAKPTIDTSKTYTSAELYNKDLSYIAIDDNDIENRIPQDIIDNYCQIVTINEEVIDPEKLLPYFKEKYPNVYANVTAENTDLNVGTVKSADEITATIIDYNHTIDKLHASVTITSQNQQFDITKIIPVQVYTLGAAILCPEDDFRNVVLDHTDADDYADMEKVSKHFDIPLSVAKTFGRQLNLIQP